MTTVVRVANDGSHQGRPFPEFLFSALRFGNLECSQSIARSTFCLSAIGHHQTQAAFRDSDVPDGSVATLPCIVFQSRRGLPSLRKLKSLPEKEARGNSRRLNHCKKFPCHNAADAGCFEHRASLWQVESNEDVYAFAHERPEELHPDNRHVQNPPAASSSS